MVLNTPSHHRMHHRPPGNCNYGGFLIIWDRLFNTFREELEMKDYYGLAQQLQSNNPLYANIAHIRRMLNIPLEDEDNNNKQSESSSRGNKFFKTILHVIRVIFKKRVIHPHVVTLTHFKQLPKPLPSTYGSAPPDRIRYGSLPSDQLSYLSLCYVLTSFTLTTLYGIRLLTTHTTIQFDQLILQVIICIFSLTCIGLLTEKNIKYSGVCESIRVFGIVLVLLIHGSFETLEGCSEYFSAYLPKQLISPWNDTMKSGCQYQYGFNLQPYFLIPVVLSKEICLIAAWLLVMIWAYIYRTEYSSQGKKYQKIKEIWKFAHPDELQTNSSIKQD